jgi:hypothetical protein
MTNPVYTVNGQPVSRVSCGQTIGFDVPGYSQAWVIVAQNGQTTFDGPMSLPMPPYRLRCPDDVGDFQVAAYELVNGQRGNVIGATRITVDAEQVQMVPAPNGTPPPMGQPLYAQPPQIIETIGGGGPPLQFEDEPAPEPGFFASMDLTTVALLAIGALVVLPLLRRKG